MKRLILFLCFLCCLLFIGSANAAPVLLDFYADWCGPCKAMAPAIDALIQEGCTVQRVNIDENRELAARYGVAAIPCFIVVDEGREIDRIEGRATLDRLRIHLGKRPAKTAPPPAAVRARKPWHEAVVRVECDDGHRVRSLGSGVLVKWGAKIVCITARHVIQDARGITILLATGKRHAAHVVKFDAVWDCAVLEIEGRVGVAPAEIAFGVAAKFTVDEQLESVGYGGPETKLASNIGVFIGYRRSEQTPDGPDDWGVLSGAARHGDSGGPVFDARGRVVGILWGTDGKEVVFVQAGRVHVVLQAAEGRYDRQAWEPSPQFVHSYDPAGKRFTYERMDCDCPFTIDYRKVACEGGNCGGDCGLVRRPTAPMPGPVLDDPVPQAAAEPSYALKYREEQARETAAIKAEIQAIHAEIQQITAAMNKQPPPAAPDPGLQAALGEQQRRLAELEGAQAKKADSAAKSPGTAIDQKLDEFLKKLPIQGPLTKLEEKQLESGKPLERFFGATAAVVFLTLLGVFVVALPILLGHKIYQYCHANLPAITAKEAAIPVIGAGLASATTALDAFNTAKIEPLLAKVTGAIQSATDKAKADLTAHVAALATPAPGQPPAATTPAIATSPTAAAA